MKQEAKAYDEALERAKSEDERIRKAIKLMYSFLPNNPKYIGGVCIKEIFAWLEKQGEKPQGKSAFELWRDMRLEAWAQASGNRHEPPMSDYNSKLFSIDDIDEIMEKITEKQGEKPINDADEEINGTELKTYDQMSEEKQWQDVRKRAAIAAMQGLLANTCVEGTLNDFARWSIEYAHALVEQLKKK